MNIFVANKGGEFLSEHFSKLARKGWTFTLDWHQGGKYNSQASTTIVCNACGARLMIAHSGLPAKGNAVADEALIANVNSSLVRFLFDEQAIEDGQLFQKRLCWEGC